MPRSEEPLISVIVPAYQAAQTIEQTLMSVRSQAFADWEAVVIDDGSTDDTAGVVAGLAADDHRIRLVRQPNAGVSAARNTGIDAARGAWLLFLDADDRLAPDGLEALASDATAATEWVHGGWVRVVDGRPQRTQHAQPLADPVDVLARSCPFAIHACLVRAARVREVGGFDTSFVTCEDWDLWRKLAGAGVRPVPVDALVAEYVVRGDSASMATRQLLRDGLRQIATAHREAGFPDADRRAAEAAFRAYVAGIAIGRGDDASWTLGSDTDGEALDADPRWVAEMLYAGVPLGAVVGAEDWPTTAETLGAARVWLEALERATGGLQLARRTTARLESLVASGLGRSDTPTRVGRTTLVDLDLEAAPFSDLPLDEAVERVEIRAWIADDLVGAHQLLPTAASVAGPVLLDAALTESAWAAVEHFVLAPRALGSADGDDDWTALLREIFGDRTARAEDFYNGRVRGGARRVQAAPIVQIELTDGLPEIRGASGPVTIDVTLGGEPLDRFALAPERGRVPAGRLRTQVAVRNGLGLAQVAMRAYLSRPADARGGSARSLFAGESSRGELARAVAQLPFTGVPLGARRRLYPATGIADPATASAATTMAAVDAVLPPTGEARRSAASFDALFTSEEDPWSYETGYEARKYEQTLRLLPPSPSAVLELACAEGHFTERIAGVADRVVATDVSALAIDRARRRCAEATNVEFRQHDLFADPIDGRWSVIVCSEVLYYAGEVADLVPVVRKILRALEPGGVLVTAHANLVVDDASAPGFDWGEAYGSLGIQRAILATGLATLEHEVVTPMYRVQRYRRRSRLATRLRPPSPTTERAEASDDLSPDVRAHFLPDGGESQGRRSTERVPRSVPILMYHRVSPTGAPAMRRWRVTPAEFDAQLAFLAGAGFTAISLDTWRDAIGLGLPLPPEPIVLTFDDGYVDFAEHALPILQRYEFEATLFAVSGLVGGTNRWDAHRESLPLMDWAQLEAIAGAGIDIGAHTSSHPPLTSLTPAQMLDEIAASITTIGDRLGRVPTSFAYPFGDLTTGVAGIAALAGVHVAVTCEDRVATDRDDLLRLPRIEVRGDGDPLRDLVQRLGGW